MTNTNHFRFQFGIRSLFAVMTWSAIGLSAIMCLPEECHAVPFIIAVVCLAVAWECKRFPRTRRLAITFFAAMAIQLLVWIIFVIGQVFDAYGLVYFQIMFCYDRLGLIPNGGFAFVPVVLYEVPIVGATLYSLIAVTIVAWREERARRKVPVTSEDETN